MYPDYLVHFNPNHDPKNGQFTFSKNGSSGYNNTNLDTKYNTFKNDIFSTNNLKWLTPEDNAEEKWGKDIAKAADIGIEALGVSGEWGDPGDLEENDVRSWFMLEDQTIGYPGVAYLAMKGKSRDEILDIMKSCYEMEKINSEVATKYRDSHSNDINSYTDNNGNKLYSKSLLDEARENTPYKNVFELADLYGFDVAYKDQSESRMNDYNRLVKYIDSCIKVSKEMEHSDTSKDCLQHFNPNHDKLGRFSFSKFNTPERQARRADKKDERWAKRNYNRLYKKAYKPIKKEMSSYVKRELNPKYAVQLRSGKISKSYMNEYNRKLAELMNKSVDELDSAPSGKVISFIAKRGDLGVHMALATPGYDTSKFKSGIYSTGRVAYKKTNVNMV